MTWALLGSFWTYLPDTSGSALPGAQAVSPRPEQRNGEDESPYQKYLNPIFILTFGTIDRSVSHCEFILYVH